MTRPKTKNVVYVPGTWDLFHHGHVAILKKARRIATTLIAGVNTDESVEAGKGRRPTMAWRERAAVVLACRHVDCIVANGMDIPVDRLRQLGVDTIVLGSDWAGKDLPGLAEAEKTMRIVYYKYTDGISTTEIRKRISAAERKAR